MVLGLCPHGFTWKMNRFRVVIPLKVFVSDVIKCRSFVTSLEGDDRKDALLPRNKEDQPPKSKRVDIGVRDFVLRTNERGYRERASVDTVTRDEPDRDLRRRVEMRTLRWCGY